MDTWINFESRFKELAPRLQSSRIDDQTGAVGEYWRLSGVNNDREAEQEFQTLCSIAGNHITEVLGGIEAYSIILDNEGYAWSLTSVVSEENKPANDSANERRDA